MKAFKMVGIGSCGLLIGFALASFKIQSERGVRTAQAAALRASLEQAEQAQKIALVQRDQFKGEADRLRQWSGEVHRLRAEVSGLKRELTESYATRERITRIAKTEAVSEAPNKLKGGEGGIAVESVPSAVQATLSREIGNGPVNGFLSSSTDKNGRITYGFKGVTADNRAIGLRLAEDGSIIEKSQEIPTDIVPIDIQGQVATMFGSIAINAAREIVEGDNVRYELTGKGPEAGVQAMIRRDGTILSYSAKWREPERGKEKK